MKTKYFFNIFLTALVAISCKINKPSIVKITEDMVVNESGFGAFMNWFDEQDTTAIPKTYWNTRGLYTFWPAGLVIDLGCKYQITSILIYDGEKSEQIKGGKLIISSGKPFEWEGSVIQDIKNSENWVRINWNAETRFIQLQKQATEKYYKLNCDLSINEVVIVGCPLEEKPAKNIVAKKKNLGITMDQLIGMNSYIDTPDKLHEAVGTVREYRPWRWNGVMDLDTPIDWGTMKQKGGKNEYANMKIGNSDEYYQKMLDMGVECSPCIHRHVDEENEHHNIPCFGGDPNDPFSYRIMADYTFQYVARYGHTKIDDSLLRTTEASPKKSGMGLIRYFENWNEPNRWWKEPEGHFTPYQFAAFCSASYDGHMNQMGEGFGAKNADPNIQFVTGGVAALPENSPADIFKAMKLWSDYYRNGSFPADVFQAHYYCTTRYEWDPKPSNHGISPEEYGLKEKMEQLTKWRDENYPEKEVWLGEFGWDTDSTTYTSAAWGHDLYPEGITMNEIQAQWLVRSYLVGAAAGVDRMIMFLANDLKSYPRGVYGSSGFITVNQEYKPSWYYTKTLKYALKGMIFHAEIESGDENVWVYQFKNSKTGVGAYVFWCPTANGTSVDNFELKLNEGIEKVTLIEMKDKEEFGVKKKLKVIGQQVKVNVSERPIIVLLD